MGLRDLGEFGIIKEIFREFPLSDPKVVKGIGDDAAVIEMDSKNYLLSTTDTLIEDVHFSLTYISPFLLGRRAVTISLSDIAAMGGTPKYLLISIALPDKIETDFIGLFYKGIKELTEAFSIELIGGNTSSSPDRLIIGTFMLGQVTKEQVIYRDGAKEGDRIYVTGTLGDSALGLKILKGCDEGQDIDDSPYRDAIMAHIAPQPRVEVGRTLAEKGLLTAMIDISDGLLQDLRHLTEGSRVGARIELSRMPLSPTFKRHLLENPEDRVLPLTGGEDYELLFTSSPSLASDIEEAARELSCPLSPIGEIVSLKEDIKVIDENGSALSFKDEGFDHFIQVRDT